MKRLTAIILLALMTLFMFTGCKREGEMIETMVSSIFSTENRNDANNDTTSSGRVTDNDGYIGNEKEDNSTASDGTNMLPTTTNVSDNNVI